LEGGIWADDHAKARPEDPEIAAAQDGDVDELTHLEATEESDEAVMAMPEMEKSMSTPLTDASPPEYRICQESGKVRHESRFKLGSIQIQRVLYEYRNTTL